MKYKEYPRNRQREYGLYEELWGNYKSDKWKTKGILRAEITNMLSIFHFTKDEMKEIKNKILEITKR